MTARLLVEIGLFPNMKKANRRLLKLVARKRVREIGHAKIDGSWQNVYFRGRYFGSNVVQHNTELTYIKWTLNGYDVERWDVPHHADLLLVSPADTFLWEHDRDMVNHAQVRGRVQKLMEWPHTILWDAPTERRLRELIRLTEPLGDRCLFTTFRTALTPHAEGIWAYRDGEAATLPPGDGPG